MPRTVRGRSGRQERTSDSARREKTSRLLSVRKPHSCRPEKETNKQKSRDLQNRGAKAGGEEDGKTPGLSFLVLLHPLHLLQLRLTLGSALVLSPGRQVRAPRTPHVLPLPSLAAPAPHALHSPEGRRGPAGPASEVGSRAGPWAAPRNNGSQRSDLRDVRGQAREKGREQPRTQQWWRLVAARAPGTLQAGGSATSPAEGRSRRRGRRRGRRRPGPEGERVGQRRIASAHCCPARSGAARSRAR